jgi:putative membrane protein
MPDDTGPEKSTSVEPESTRTSRSVRTGVVLAAIAGVAISTVLIAYHSFAAVGEAVWKTGWGLGIIVALHLVAVVFCGLAWRLLFVSRPPKTIFLIALRWIRESVNTLLPVARVGGDLAGARLLVNRGTAGNMAGASLVADRTVEVFSQFFFAIAGVTVLIKLEGNHDLSRWGILSLIIMFPVLIAFIAAQRLGLLRVLETFGLKILHRWTGTSGNGDVGIHDALWQVYGNARGLASATFLHTLGWIIGAVQIWLALTFMGHKLGFADAFIIESLSQVICTAAFIMPAALGAQEAGYMVVGGLLGVPPELGLALSLIKRLCDVICGVPGLLLWQALEGRRLWTHWRRRGDAKSPSVT